MRAALRSLAAAFALLTRLPIAPGPLAMSDLGAAVGWFPLVGLVLGLAGTGLGYLLGGVLPPLLLAALLVALLTALTGALHLDGLSDLFDGLAGGGGDRRRTLEIMRDSRIGAQRATALVLALAVKIAGVAAALEAADLTALLLFPAVARWAVVAPIVVFRTARDEGMAHDLRAATSRRGVLWATVILAPVVVALGAPAALQAGVTLGVVLLVGLWIEARLGGLTGDAYGALIELGEVAALVTAAAWR